MESLLRELAYALRQLRRSPAFTLMAVLTLGFGIGAASAIFSIVEGVLLRPLPFPDPSRLVVLADVVEGVDYGDDVPGVTARGVLTYMRDTNSFSDLGGYQPSTYEFSGVGEPEQIYASRQTASIFRTLGVSPLIGRTFTREEDESSVPVAVLSYKMWHNRFHGDPNVLGQKILLDRKPYEVIGVMPRQFEFPLAPGRLYRSELWIPMSLTPADLSQGSPGWSFYMVGRLKPGVTIAQAQQDSAAAALEIMRNFPPALAAYRIHPLVQPIDETIVSQARPLIRTLFWSVMVVLFIACTNLTALLLVRTIRRRREISVRLALGATSGALIRQSLIEVSVLAAAGGVVGLLLAWTALRLGIGLLPETFPRVSSIGLDWHVVLFTLGLVALTSLLCGLVPALVATRANVNDALKEGGRTGSAGGSSARLRSILVVSELAVALVLLTASGLLLRSFEKMRAVDLGFHSDHMLTAHYDLPRRQYSTQPDVDAFDRSLREKLEELPGVQAVGITTLLPAAGQNIRTTFIPEGYVPPKGAGLNLVWESQLIGNYFAAAGIPLIRGRDFTEADNATAPLVAIVNRVLAERYWPGEDPVGKRLHFGSSQAGTRPWLRVVGEIGNVKELAADSPTMNQIYVPVSQAISDAGQFATSEMLVGNSASVIVRGQQPPEQLIEMLQAMVRSIDPQLPLTQVEAMQSVIEDGQMTRWFGTALVSSFAVAAVLLALLGIYGIMAFSCALRTQEMAIRMALGSSRSSVMRLVLSSGAKLGLAGCGIGTLAAIFVTRLLRSLLFEVDAFDPVVMLMAAFSIFMLAVLASLIPAHRAASVEPLEALRIE
jgi:putative ABC transport system permease protein